jgi:2,4-dienoyl-CoA reductase-like NADH-dependent reductase (Old Yellow Enzyme family)
MPHLFEPLALRDAKLSNRIAVSPMCQYSSENGFANDWHFVHLGSRAVGGAGLVFTEAAAVLPEGRISPQDLGIWNDDHVETLARIVRFIHEQGSVAGIQLAHAGRKASTYRPWDGHGLVPEADGGWPVVGPSAVAFAEGYALPAPLTEEEIRTVIEAFRRAACRACEAGFRVLEIHAAHGYLMHEFLSPLSNQRQDRYGGSFENRIRLVCEVVEAVRRIWPDRCPLLIRISTTDWVAGGWDLEQSIELVRHLGALGVDLIDCSSGGTVPQAEIPAGPGFQAPFAERIRRETGMPTGTVGFITSPTQADHVIRSGQADLVLLARQMLRDPYWPLRAARELRCPVAWPVQYLLAAPTGTQARSTVELPRLERCFAEHHAVVGTEQDR